MSSFFLGVSYKKPQSAVNSDGVYLYARGLQMISVFLWGILAAKVAIPGIRPF